MLISFDLFHPSFGNVLIHERLSVRLSLHTNDMQKICSNMCFTHKPTAPFPKELTRRLSTADNDPGYHPTNLKNPINLSFLHDDIMSKRKMFSVVLEVYKLSDSDNENVRDLNANE